MDNLIITAEEEVQKLYQEMIRTLPLSVFGGEIIFKANGVDFPDREKSRDPDYINSFVEREITPFLEVSLNYSSFNKCMNTHYNLRENVGNEIANLAVEGGRPHMIDLNLFKGGFLYAKEIGLLEKLLSNNTIVRGEIHFLKHKIFKRWQKDTYLDFPSLENKEPYSLSLVIGERIEKDKANTLENWFSGLKEKYS